MADPKKTRSSLKGSITKLKTNVDAFNPDTVRVTQVEVHMKRLEKYATRLEANHDTLFQACKDQVEEAAEQADYEGEDQRLVDLEISLCDLLQAAKLRENSQQNQQQPLAGPAPQVQAQGVALRKLDLPKFSGNYEDWPTFMDMFSAMVHSKTNYSDHEKLWYLKQALEENVPAVLSATAITDANYAGAWQAVNERFNHPRLLISAQINKALELPHMKTECPKELRRLLDTLAAALRALKGMNVETKDWEPFLVCLVTNRLDVETRRQWEQSLPTKDMPSFDQLEKFLTRRCEAMESLVTAPIKQRPNSNDNSSFKKEKSSAAYHAANGSCVLCDEDHLLNHCNIFHSNSVPSRINLVKKHQLCFNCLRAGHSAVNCHSGTCRKCNEKHHTLLHLEMDEIDGPEKLGASSFVSTLYTKKSRTSPTVLLSTARVKVMDKYDNALCARALIDNCSEGSFVTENFVQKLGLKRENHRISVTGLGRNDTGRSNGLVSLIIRPHFKNDFELKVDAFVMPNLTGKLPKSPVHLNEDSNFRHLILADPAFGMPADTDILLGADVFSEIINGGVLHGGETETLKAYNTRLGWILSGKFQQESTPSIRVMHASVSMEDQLQKYWHRQEVQSLKSQLTGRETRCEDTVAATTSMKPGQYPATTPFRPTVGSIYKIPQRRMPTLGTRLAGTEPEPAKLQPDPVNLLPTGGFPSRKWSQNSVVALRSTPGDVRDFRLPLSSEGKKSVKTLGMQWNSAQHTFSYNVRPVTKLTDANRRGGWRRRYRRRSRCNHGGREDCQQKSSSFFNNLDPNFMC